MYFIRKSNGFQGNEGGQRIVIDDIKIGAFLHCQSGGRLDLVFTNSPHGTQQFHMGVQGEIRRVGKQFSSSFAFFGEFLIETNVPIPLQQMRIIQRVN